MFKKLFPFVFLFLACAAEAQRPKADANLDKKNPNVPAAAQESAAQAAQAGAPKATLGPNLVLTAQEAAPQRPVPFPKPKNPPAQNPAAAQKAAPKPAQKKQQVIVKEISPYEKYEHLWTKTKSNSFDVYKEKQGALGTPNIESILDTVYNNIRTQLPWMFTSGRTSVYLHKNRNSFINGQFNPPQWSRALFIPSMHIIAFYDDPANQTKLKKDFAHEYTHMINEMYFNPEGKKNMSPPLWLDEGIAVFMEDLTENKNGAAWANELKYLNFRSPAQRAAMSGGGGSSFGIQRRRAAVNYTDFVSFSEMMKDDSLSKADDGQTWYLQAYAMVRFLWRPDVEGGTNKNFQFQKFLSYLTGIDAVTNKPIARRSMAAALKEAYGYENTAAFERDFWYWLPKQKARNQAATQKNTSSGAKGYGSSFGYPSSSTGRSAGSTGGSALRGAKPAGSYAPAAR